MQKSLIQAFTATPERPVLIPAATNGLVIDKVETLKAAIQTKASVVSRDLDQFFADFEGSITKENVDDVRKKAKTIKAEIKKVDKLRTAFFRPITDYSLAISASFKAWSSPLTARLEEREKEVTTFLQAQMAESNKDKIFAEKVVIQFEDAMEKMKSFVLEYVKIFESHKMTDIKSINRDSIDVLTAIDMIDDPDLCQQIGNSFNWILDKIKGTNKIESGMNGDINQKAQIIGQRLANSSAIRNDYSSLHLGSQSSIAPFYKKSEKDIKPIGLKKVININIEDPRQLPDSILNNPAVIEAMMMAVKTEAKALMANDEDPNQVSGSKVRISYE